MDYRSEWTARALRKFRTIIARITEHNPSAAMRLEAAIRKKIALLRSFPSLAGIYQIVPEGEIREAQVGNYRIFYLVLPNDALIKIVRIQHASMDDPDFGD